MTVTPVATHGFFLDGKWLEEGDIVDVRAPYDGALIAHVHQGRANMPKPPLRPPSRLSGPLADYLPSNASEFCARLRLASMIGKKSLPARIALEAGKPIKSARTEVDRAIFTFNIAAEETVRGYGEYLPLGLAAIDRRTLGHRETFSARS